MSLEHQYANPSSEIDPTIESHNPLQRLAESRSGTTHPASQLQPMSQSIPEKSKAQAKSKRKAKNETGIWMVEKSLDKKHWVADAWVPTRQVAKVVTTRSENRSHADGLGIHYRVTRYEPAR